MKTASVFIFLNGIINRTNFLNIYSLSSSACVMHAGGFQQIRILLDFGNSSA